MKHLPIIGVFGLSGLGKSWMIAHFATHTPVLHVQASQLLRDAKAALIGDDVTSEDLRKGAVLDNQALLIKAFARVRQASTQPIVFDGHSVVDTGAKLLEIPTEVIASLELSYLVFLEGSPAIIIERRHSDTKRTRPARDEHELIKHQERAKAMCKKYSQTLGLPLAIIAVEDQAAFANAMLAGLSTHSRSEKD